MNKDTWSIAVSGLLKAELAKKNLNYIQLKEKLAEIGINEGISSIRNKLSRGSFSATFFFQCLYAIGVKQISLEGIELDNE